MKATTRAIHAAAPLALTALLVAGCGTDDNESAYTPPTPPPSPTSAASPTPTETATASPMADSAQWATCTTERAALRVSYPDDWTMREHSAGGCAYFDPEPFEIQSATEAPAVAVRLDVENAPYDTVRDAYLRNEVISQQDVTVAGYDGVRVEDRDTEGPLGAKGHRFTYLADLGDDQTLVLTTNETDADDVERAQEVLDEMAERMQRQT